MHEIIELLFPISCLGCNQEKNSWLCFDCSTNLPLLISEHCPACGQKTNSGATCSSCRTHCALDGAVSFIPYADPLIEKIIQAWKYQNIRSLSNELGNFMLTGLEIIKVRLDQAKKQIYSGFSYSDINRATLLPTLLLDKNTWLISVPLHAHRLRTRGFNQADDLAKIISTKNNWPLMPIVERIKNTSAQARLTDSDRAANIKEAFRLNIDKKNVKNKKILLVDDVITTSSTCEAIAKILKQAGADTVWALTVAYAR